MTEEWRQIDRNQHYEVSVSGQVRSLPRIIHWRTRWGTIGSRLHKGGLIYSDPHHSGYLQIKLGGPKIYRVHQLVAWAFIGRQPAGTVINHIDGDKWNNRRENLEYVSNSDNVKHAYRTGLLSNRGEANGKAVLTEEMVRRIRSLPITMTHRQVAELVGCKKHNVAQVRSGRAWRHIT